MHDAIRVGSALAKRGEKVWGEIPLPDAGKDRVKPPKILLLNGVAEGPTVYVGAGAHGDEFNAIEALRRAAATLDPQSLKGAAILVPVQNRAAFDARTRRTPADDKDIDQCYPGDPEGSPTDVLAHLLFREAVTKADRVLDLHTASRGGWNLLHSLCPPGTAETSTRAQQLARAFGVRVMVSLETPTTGHVGQSAGWNLDHNLFVQASARNIPSVIIEFGGPGRLETEQVELGFQGIMNVLAELDMINPTVRWQPSRPFAARQAVVVRCQTQGFLYPVARPGNRVQKGDLLARIVSLANAVEEIISPEDGMVMQVATDGVLVPNDRVVVIAIE